MQITELLERVATRYATCRSYQDEGDVRTVLTAPELPGGSHVMKRPFTTAFLRPDRFRFESWQRGHGERTEWPQLVVWADGQLVRSWWTSRPRVETHASMHEALGGPTGVSGRSAWLIPSLLLPGGPGWKTLPSPERIGAVALEQMDGMECYRLDTRPSPVKKVSIWIEAGTSSIRRIDGHSRFTREFLEQQRREVSRAIAANPGRFGEDAGNHLESFSQRPTRGFESDTRTSYRPSFDVDLEPAVFAFSPPVT